ncbi:MAG: hypothetical protein GXP24_06140 [Planctomycetes bacterium]|nr:hypothetical protein [Planctomycetota bacterium]
MSFQQTAWAAICSTLLMAATTYAEPTSSPADSSPLASSPLASSSQAPTVKKMKLQKKQLGDMQPVHALGDIYLAGQPTPEDLSLLKREGIKTVITLRKPEEVPWDEAAAVTQQGMKYVEAPFQAVEELKPEIFDKVLKVLRDKKRGPTMLHCGSANRVGAIWYAYRVLDGKLTPEAALEEAKIVGLRTQGYLDQAQVYVEKIQNQPPATVIQEPQVDR